MSLKSLPKTKTFFSFSLNAFNSSWFFLLLVADVCYQLSAQHSTLIKASRINFYCIKNLKLQPETETKNLILQPEFETKNLILQPKVETMYCIKVKKKQIFKICRRSCFIEGSQCGKLGGGGLISQNTFIQLL